MLSSNMPRHAGQLTPEWLTAALSTTGVLTDTEITSCNLETVGADTGFLGELVRVTPTYSQGPESGPSSFIVKFPSTDPDARGTGDSLRAFEREAQFYRNFAGEDQLGQPAHLFSICDIEAGDYLLILEDIGHARFVGQMEGAGPEDALKVASALGTMHGRYWNSDTIRNASWLPNFSEWANIYPPEIDTGRPLVVQNFGHLLSDNVSNHMDQGTAAYPALVHAFQDHAQTLVHCDPRIENLCFEESTDGDLVRLYDWQLVSRGPAAYDLMYFMAQSLETDVRREIEGDICQAWLQAIGEHGVTDYGASELSDDLSIASCHMWGFMGVIGNVVKPDEKGMPIAQVTLPRWCALMDDHGASDRLQEFVG